MALYVRKMNFEIDLFKKSSEIEDGQPSEAFVFSSRLVGLLNEKASQIRGNGVKITHHKLKSVYVSSAEAYSEDLASGKSRGLFALARVNMFIRMLGENGDFYKKINKAKIKANQDLLDIASYFEPAKEDYAIASAEIEQHQLKYDFQNVEELYLENPDENRYWFEI